MENTSQDGIFHSSYTYQAYIMVFQMLVLYVTGDSCFVRSYRLRNIHCPFHLNYMNITRKKFLYTENNLERISPRGVFQSTTHLHQSTEMKLLTVIIYLIAIMVYTLFQPRLSLHPYHVVRSIDPRFTTGQTNHCQLPKFHKL